MGLSTEPTPLSFPLAECRVCGSRSLRTVLDLGNQPLANRLEERPYAPEPRIPLIICRCETCGTIQLTETVRPEVLFRKYVWVTGTSGVAQEYSRLFYERVSKRVGQGARFVIEVASNDGTFLMPFAAQGHRVLGVDPAENIAALARARGIPTKSDFFGLEVGRSLVSSSGPADVVFARNVIPHVANAQDVVAGMAECLRPSGIGVVEFHRGDIILKELHYDSIYHEHLCYHTLASMTRLLEGCGLHPFDVETSPISGGSFVLYATKEKIAPSKNLLQQKSLEADLGVSGGAAWDHFAGQVVRHRDLLRNLVLDFKAKGLRLAGYGASARSSTLLNYCGLTRDHLDAIADRAELKHGKFAPGTGIPILPPKEVLAGKPDVLLLLAWNFQDEILRQLREEFHWRGRIILPLPEDPRVITVS